ncbi:HAMP domain-containing sensor histidine kinase [Reyranella sp. CPCC 100927]|uniref:sensor histidine kinase n=1 Tax=Reyranella sp. CPCC 100927 TaxID=2599616 RepID=UPI0015B52166|nr:HAMP domain-containing sensor histidine kinase [Reyranella sp. CPCC 100927]
MSGARRLGASLTLKLIAIVGIFVTLPIVLYGQFESADRQTRDLVTRSIQDRSRLIAQAITPVLAQMAAPSQDVLNGELQKYGADGTILKLMLQPAAGQGQERAFYYVASAPKVASGQVGTELDELAQRGILKRLSESCIWDSQGEIRYRQPDGTVEILTSLIPIKTPAGCWVLISTHATSEFLSTSIGRPYWQTREVRVAALIYLVLALVAVLVAVSIRRSLRRFRDVAHEIRQGRIGEYAFTNRNVVPELASVARDFDRLVLDLRRVARDMRQTAEDNAHAFKTPLATIQSAIEPIRRRLAPDDERAQRALVIIDSSIDRLKAMVNAAQRLDINTADLIDAPRRRIDLTQLVGDTLVHYRETLAGRQIRLVRRLDDKVMVRAGAGMLEVVLQNVFDNAVSFSDAGTTIIVTLTAAEETAELRVEDEGPGITADKIDRIFERYFSSRPKVVEPVQALASGQTAAHAGLGLWIVRRNVEALGGRVTASNRMGGGLCIRITLPCNGTA